MFLLLFIVAFHSFNKIVSTQEMPERTRNGLMTANSSDKIYQFAVLASDDLDSNWRRNQSHISWKCDLNDACILVPVCVPIEPDSDDPESPYFPRQVKLTRCVDSRHDHDKHCHPISKMVNITVMHFKYTVNGTGYRTTRKLTKENHTSCNYENTPPMETGNSRPKRSTEVVSTTISKCDRYNQCTLDEAQTRDDCNQYEMYDSNCCSCICSCPIVDADVCSCPENN